MSTEKSIMKSITYTNSKYVTSHKNVSFMARVAPSFSFYLSFVNIVLSAAFIAKRGKYSDTGWVNSSYGVLQLLEKVGMRVEVSGIEHLQSHDGPCVIIGNHMSMMETMLLPTIIMPFRKITFVVKESLLHYPVFKYVMRSRNPIAVSRTNPRQDLKTVMTEGVARLKEGRSVVVFPQTTRSHIFEASQMSSIGVKLAKRAGVPIIPLALKTDAWTNGTRFKDFGRIDTTKPSCFAFDKPIFVEGKGAKEQEVVNNFIEEKLREWR